MAIRKRRIEAALLVTVVFVLGIVLGSTGIRWWDERVQGQVQRQPAAFNLAPTRSEKVADLTQRLQLTPEQRQRVAVAIDDMILKLRTLYSPLAARREEIRWQGRDRIRAILTPDQQIKFDDFYRQVDEQRKLEEQRENDRSH
jgi:hypothetical protein